jgi:hypothetical protein
MLEQKLYHLEPTGVVLMQRLDTGVGYIMREPTLEGIGS